MIRLRQNTSLQEQRGAVIMIMLLILIMGSAYFLLIKLNKGDAQQPRNIDMTVDLGAITDALIGYALAHGNCFPCPDTDNDGQAEANCGLGAPVVGTLPWITLSEGAIDTWGRRLRYAVDPDFTDSGSGSCIISASQTGEIRVQGYDSTGTPYDLTTDAPALVLAYGANGYGGVSEGGAVMPNPPAAHLDETTNSSATEDFIQRPASTDSAVAGGPFDDLLAWVSLAAFKAQLIKATGGPLPPP